MKKVLILLFCLFTCFGCQKEDNSQLTLYHDILSKLCIQQQFDQPDFRIQLVYYTIDEGYRYDIIIDQPQVDMYDLTALCYNDEDKDDICPSIGIFDQESFHMKKNYIDKENGYYKGLQLSGTCQKKNDVLLYISYYTDEAKTQKVEKYLKVEENEIR